MAASPSPLLVVDTPSMLYRAFFGLPKTIKGADGKPVNALLGTANLILAEVEKHQPRAVVLCFGPDAAAYRTELYPGYHAARPEMPELLVPQWDRAREFFTRWGWVIAEDPRYEADDVLGTLAGLETEAGGRTLIMTGDRDLFQCASDTVTVLYVSTGKQGGVEVDPAEVETRYGIPPALVPDFIALRGDPSDGLPGAKGVGEKTAAELLREHGSLEGILEAAIRIQRPALRKTLIASADELRDFREIATLRAADVPLPGDQPTDWPAASEAAREFGMNRLAERLSQRT